MLDAVITTAIRQPPQRLHHSSFTPPPSCWLAGCRRLLTYEGRTTTTESEYRAPHVIPRFHGKHMCDYGGTANGYIRPHPGRRYPWSESLSSPSFHIRKWGC